MVTHFTDSHGINYYRTQNQNLNAFFNNTHIWAYNVASDDIEVTFTSELSHCDEKILAKYLREIADKLEK